MNFLIYLLFLQSKQKLVYSGNEKFADFFDTVEYFLFKHKD